VVIVNDADDALLPIGMFSRASSLSIKTLRAYHEAGILVPARVDRQSGYRSYTVDQLADAAIVLRLRALDLPLEQVRDVLRSRDPELTRAVLAAHQVEMQARLETTERIVAELQSGVVTATHTPVHVRYDDAVHTVGTTRSVTAAELWDWLDGVFEKINATIREAGRTPLGSRGALYGAEIVEDDVEDVEAFVPVTEPFFIAPASPTLAIGEVPAGWVAVLVHAGDYDTILDTYRVLGAWVARHAEHAGERVRESYVIGASEVDDPAQYRTEIAWPIHEPAPAPGSQARARSG
jgi:DNA-binding transcriptional MerR regulator